MKAFEHGTVASVASREHLAHHLLMDAERTTHALPATRLVHDCRCIDESAAKASAKCALKLVLLLKQHASWNTAVNSPNSLLDRLLRTLLLAEGSKAIRRTIAELERNRVDVQLVTELLALPDPVAPSAESFVISGPAAEWYSSDSVYSAGRHPGSVNQLPRTGADGPRHNAGPAAGRAHAKIERPHVTASSRTDGPLGPRVHDGNGSSRHAKASTSLNGRLPHESVVAKIAPTDVDELNKKLKTSSKSSAAMHRLIEHARSAAGVAPNGATYSTLIGKLSFEGDQAGVAKSLAEMDAAGIERVEALQPILDRTAEELSRMRTGLLRRLSSLSDFGAAERLFDCLLANRALDVHQLNEMLKVSGSSAAMQRLIERARSAAGVAPNGVTYSTLIGQLSIEGDQAGVAKSLAEMDAAGIERVEALERILDRTQKDLSRLRTHRLNGLTGTDADDLKSRRSRADAEQLFDCLLANRALDVHQLNVMLKVSGSSAAMQRLIERARSAAGVAPNAATFSTLIGQLSIEGDQAGVVKSLAEMDAAGIDLGHAAAQQLLESLLANRALNVKQLNVMLKVSAISAVAMKPYARGGGAAGSIAEMDPARIERVDAEIDPARLERVDAPRPIPGSAEGEQSAAEWYSSDSVYSAGLHTGRFNTLPSTGAHDPRQRTEEVRLHNSDEHVEVRPHPNRPSAEAAVAGGHNVADRYQQAEAEERAKKRADADAAKKQADAAKKLREAEAATKAALSAMLNSGEDSVAMQEVICHKMSDAGMPLMDPPIAVILIGQLAMEGDKAGITKIVAEMGAAGMKRSDELDRILNLDESELVRMRAMTLDKLICASKFREATRLFEHMIAHQAVEVNHLHIMMKLPANTIGKQELITRAIDALVIPGSTQADNAQRTEIARIRSSLLKRIEVSTRRCIDTAVSRAFF